LPPQPLSLPRARPVVDPKGAALLDNCRAGIAAGALFAPLRLIALIKALP